MATTTLALGTASGLSILFRRAVIDPDGALEDLALELPRTRLASFHKSGSRHVNAVWPITRRKLPTWSSKSATSRRLVRWR
jgi:hypothetical protein